MPMLRPNVVVKNIRKREGRGFSMQELTKAELDPCSACQLGVAVDKRRASVLDENVKILKYLKAEARKK